MSKRKYYTLCERTPSQLWSPEFGDYDRAVVSQEGDDMKNSGSFVKGTKLKIIETDGKQKSIMDKIEEMNKSVRLLEAARKGG